MSGLVYHLAQLNVARALAPLDDPKLADFMAALDRINALADAAPGFVWRLQGDSGNATDIRHDQDPNLLVNLSVWEGSEPLFDYVYKSAHSAVMARRREWFEKRAGPHLVLWWLPAGALPSVNEAMARLARLAAEGPTPAAFTFKQRFAPPAAAMPAGLADAAR
ncbi:MAG: DUF3291 domain-containing protein [Kiloniellales bacterium]